MLLIPLFHCYSVVYTSVFIEYLMFAQIVILNKYDIELSNYSPSSHVVQNIYNKYNKNLKQVLVVTVPKLFFIVFICIFQLVSFLYLKKYICPFNLIAS